MIECQSRYEKYLILKDSGCSEILETTKKEWKSAIADLGVALLEVHKVLSIFSPKALREIEAYCGVESFLLHTGVTTVKVANKEFGNLLDEGFDTETMKMVPNFSFTIDCLNDFIRKNFKPEEIHTAKVKK